MASSPFRPGATTQDQLAYYKAQYEQLELELQEFQASSRELEAELEKDVEASEKRERKLKEQVDNLGYEAEEWKTKCKQSKDEANRAQNALQKEITTMRETNRSLQLKLRDVEVVNDDYEQQARHTTSSLEDLESKYNISIERGVMLEEEIRAGELERETLRIETQRLRDELSDLRIESEITLEKLRHAEATIERFATRRPPPLHAKPARPLSQLSQASMTTPPSPSTSTPPPTKSEASSSEALTPPSPPLSDALGQPRIAPKPQAVMKRKSLLPDSNATPRVSSLTSRVSHHSRRPSVTSAATTTDGGTRMGPPPPRPRQSLSEGLPRSGSLYQIKGLIGRMQKIEERVHSVRSKLPPPSGNSPRVSPRAGSALDSHVPASVTLRSSRKRSSHSTAGSLKQDDDVPDSRFATDPVKRLSFGLQAAEIRERPSSSASRPSSRASNTSNTSQGENPFMRPVSRTSIGGARTPLGHYLSTPTAGDRRPRSSLSGNYATARRGHKPSASVSDSRDSSVRPSTPSTARRTTIDKSAIPTPSALPRSRESGVFTASTVNRRPSLGLNQISNERAMPPPAGRPRKKSAVGETF